MFSKQDTFIKHKQSLLWFWYGLFFGGVVHGCAFLFLFYFFFPFQLDLKIILTRFFFKLEGNINYISRPVTQGAFLKSVLGIQSLFAHTLIKVQSF